jgi:hypothetical protein
VVYTYLDTFQGLLGRVFSRVSGKRVQPVPVAAD